MALRKTEDTDEFVRYVSEVASLPRGRLNLDGLRVVGYAIPKVRNSQYQEYRFVFKLTGIKGKVEVQGAVMVDYLCRHQHEDGRYNPQEDVESIFNKISEEASQIAGSSLKRTGNSLEIDLTRVKAH